MTPYYVAAVWTGYDMPERIHVAGTPAAKLWRKVMTPLHEGLGWQSFTYPYLGPDTGLFADTVKVEIEDDDEDDFIPNAGGNNGGFDQFGGEAIIPDANGGGDPFLSW